VACRGVVHSADKFRKPAVFATNITAQISWVAGSFIGFTAGNLIGDIRALALDYALPAMFIALLVLQIKNRVQILVAGIAGVLAVALLLAGLSHWHILAAALIGASLGVFIEKLKNGSKSCLPDQGRYVPDHFGASLGGYVEKWIKKISS
jgi:predicted branched-subunit amino acid permease